MGGSPCFVCSYRSATRPESSRKGLRARRATGRPLWRTVTCFCGVVGFCFDLGFSCADSMLALELGGRSNGTAAALAVAFAADALAPCDQRPRPIWSSLPCSFSTDDPLLCARACVCDCGRVCGSGCDCERVCVRADDEEESEDEDDLEGFPPRIPRREPRDEEQDQEGKGI